MKYLLIDDIKVYHQVDKTCRTYQDGIDALRTEHWDVLFLDHNLNDFTSSGERTGHCVMEWIKDHPEHKPSIIICVSWNPWEKERINESIKKMYGLIFDQRHIDALEASKKA